MLKTPPPRQHPGLIRSLQYFEAVARQGAVGAAARELGVSQSAVSHQLRELTEVLGEKLIVRAGRGIVLTPAGERLAERLGDAFASLERSVASIVGGGRRAVRLAVCSSFGPGWLVPRLGRFLAAHPGIDLQLRLYAEDPHLSDQVADAIVSALPVEPGFTAVHVLHETLVAVRAPKAADGPQKLITTDLDPDQTGAEWLRYCGDIGVHCEDLRRGPWLQTTHYLLAMEMACAGLGVALVPDFIAARELERGTLELFHPRSMPSGRTYRLCFKRLRGQETGILSLAQWLRSEASAFAQVQRSAAPPSAGKPVR